MDTISHSDESSREQELALATVASLPRKILANTQNRFVLV